MTNHYIVFDSSQNMKDIESDTVELIVTSPPYPMIAMWDEMFSSMNPMIGDSLASDPTKGHQLHQPH